MSWEEKISTYIRGSACEAPTPSTSANLHDSEYALISAYQHTQTGQARSAQKVFAAHGSDYSD